MAMDFKHIQDRLKDLRDRIKAKGRLSAEDEAELRGLVAGTVESASRELEQIQSRLSTALAAQAGNDNGRRGGFAVHHVVLSEDQQNRLAQMQYIANDNTTLH